MDTFAGLYDNINLARRGKLGVLINKTEKSSALVKEVTLALPDMAGDGCNNSASITPLTASGLALTFFPGTIPDYAALIQGALTDGLYSLEYAFPNTAWSEEPWSADSRAANLGYLLWNTSTHVGCGVTDCTEGMNLLVCRFTPTATPSEMPFSEEYFHEVKIRTTDLADMTLADVTGSSASGMGCYFLLQCLIVLIAVAYASDFVADSYPGTT